MLSWPSEVPLSVEPLHLTLTLTRATEPQAEALETLPAAPRYHLTVGAGTPFDVELQPAWCAPPADANALLSVGRALRQALGERWRAQVEAPVCRALEQGREVVLTVLGYARELDALPWEALTLGEAPEERLLALATGAHGARVRLQHRRGGGSGYLRVRKPTPQRVLFAWAGLDREREEHEQALREALGPEVRLTALHAARLEDLVANLRDAPAPYDTLHLLAHGEAGGVWLHGGWSPTEAAQLAQALAPYVGTLNRVVLMVCSQGQAPAGAPFCGGLAQELHRAGVETVLASRWPLSMGYARRVSADFYTALSRWRDPAAALARARPQDPAPWAALDPLAVTLLQHDPGLAVPAWDGLRRRWARQLATWADRVPEALRPPGGPGTLGSVYVTLRLRATAERGEAEGLHPAAHAARRQARTRAVGPELDQPQPLDAVLQRPERRWALLGDPGAGKTTMLRQTALQLARDGLSAPLVLHCARLVQVWDACAAALQPGAGAVPSLLEQLVRGCVGPDPELVAWLVAEAWAERATFFLDGWDEVGEAQRPRLREALAALCAQVGDSQVVVASRPVGYTEPGAGFLALELCPLTATDQRELLGRWVPEAARREAALAQLQGARLSRLAGNPLLLTLVGRLVLEGRPVPQRRVDLYAASLDLLLDQRYRDGAAPPPAAHKQAAVEWLAERALALHGGEDDLYSVESLCAVAPPVGGPWAEASALLRWLVERAVLSVDHSAVEQARRVGFLHRTFREYLAARALCGVVPRAGHAAAPALDAVLGRARGAPERWAEVLALTCGLLADADPGGQAADGLVQRLAAERGEGGRELLHRVLAEAEGLRPEAVREVLALEQGWDKWRGRAEVIQGVPALVGDLEVAVGLLVQIGRATTDGNDLYHVHQALVDIGKGNTPWTVKEGSVEAARARARREAEGLLAGHRKEERERVKAALKALLVPIPKGEFSMGDDEGEVWEKPAHPVKMVRDFRMMKVPVTWEHYLQFDPHHGEAQRGFGGALEPGPTHAQVPVYNVTWYAATTFARWVGMRLPTEAEWEYACRAGTQTQFWSGDSVEDLKRVGWVGVNSGGHPHPVPHPEKNDFGLHDMHGNVWEWCLEPYQHDVYQQRREGVKVDPWGLEGAPTLQVGEGPPQSAESAAEGVWRVVRGGSWNVNALWARAAFRDVWHPTFTVTDFGFRLAVAVPPQLEP